MALDPNTTAKLGDWFNTTAKPVESKPQLGGGLLSSGDSPSFNTGSGVFGVQTATTGGTSPTTSPSMLNLGSLDRRNVDGASETVAGNMKSMLDEGSPYIQAARERAKGQANARGLLNSTMAASAGEAAAIDAAMPIAQADAGIYGKASDYNTALTNQARLQNVDTANKFTQQKIDADNQKVMQQADISQRTSLAKMQDDLERYKFNQANNPATSIDLQKQKMSLVNNLLMTTDLSPDRKADLLRSMGEGGFADAIYVVGSTAADLAPNGSTTPIAGGVTGLFRSIRSGSGSAPTFVPHQSDDT